MPKHCVNYLGTAEISKRNKKQSLANFAGPNKVYYGRRASGEFCVITTEQRSLFFRTPLCFEGRILTQSPAQLLNYQSMTTSCQGSSRRVFQYVAAILENAGANAAARLLMSCKKYDHITPVLINLHWLPVRYRINFKILLLTFKALYGMAPSYIIDLIHTKTNTRYLLRSNEGLLLKHPSGKMKKSFGDRSFSVAAPTLWNALPVSLRSIKCISTFKSNLKTYLFKLAFNIS